VPRTGRLSIVVALAATLSLCGNASAMTSAGRASSASAVNGSALQASLGPNVKILDPSMSTTEIKAIVDGIADQQVSSQFGQGRFAVLFKPGTYGSVEDPLNFQVGYYTDVIGLGASPDDVVINGTIDVYNQCFADGCTALVNFWRSLSNLTINVAGKGGCQFGEFWATSQATSLRRVHVNGYTTLMDYCTAPSYASGGFIADSVFSDSVVVNGSQQQYLVRDSTIDSWTNGVWNQVFAGVEGAPQQAFPNPPYTTLATSPESRERPYLFVDSDDQLSVFVPDVRFDGRGSTWLGGSTRGRSIPLHDFFVARPSDSVQTINEALARGKNLLLTPGIYAASQTIRIKRPDTIVLGLGMATLDARGGAVPMTVANVKGVEISGLLFDAGPVSSPVLLQLGTREPDPSQAGGRNTWSDPNDPSALHDVFFRVGGAHEGKTKVSLEINADHVILDNIWAWRADHGAGVGWTNNTADTGVVVNGRDVIATGLFVEHFQKTEVVWNGENGRTIMFQNEMPYDPPNQAAWRRSDDLLGYPAYKVSDSVKRHEAWGLGSYCFFNADPTIHASRAFEVPVKAGIQMHDLLSLSITNHGTIDHVVNDVGDPTSPDTTPSTVVSYP
jgi:hypothetical protein